jgi:hypothetical protein
MKTLQDYINEYEEINEASLLDMDELISDTDAKMLEYKAKELFEKYPVKGQPGVDAYGRKLEHGDWVICVPPGSKSQAVQQFGIVQKITAKKITISVPSHYGSWQYFYWGNGKANQEESPFRNISLSSEYIFKIMDKQSFINTL